MSLAAALFLAWLAPRAPDDGRFTFVVLGHLRGDANGELLDHLDPLLDAVRREAPDLVFLCGDLIWGDIHGPTTDRAAIEADWSALDAKLATLGVPVHRVPGNHDVCDTTTRDVWLARYGGLPQAIDHEGSRFLLLCSGWWPEDDSTEKHPERFIRGKDLGSDQVDFLRTQLSGTAQPRHTFVVQHHLLWWEESARWWQDVHPLLAEHQVEAVFGGDYGPLKFSHLERDGVGYWQTSIENRVSLEMLQRREPSRYLSAQLDNFLVVQVDGDDVRVDVRAVLADAGKFTPQHYREVMAWDKGTLSRRVANRFRTSEELLRGLTWTAGLAFGAGFALAILVAWLCARRRK